MSLLTNKGKNSLETRKALKNMFDTSYNQICSLENAGINPHSYYSLEVGPLASRIYKPRSNRNGVVVKLPVPISTKYTKFSLPINIISNEELKELRSLRNSRGRNINIGATKSVQSLIERSSRNMSTLEVFVDNVKVPDIDVFITVMDGSTDVYIPAKYFEIDGSKLDVIRRHYSKEEPYLHSTIRKTEAEGATISFFGCSVIENGESKILYKCDNLESIKSDNDFRVYKNGKLLQRDNYTLTQLLPGDYSLMLFKCPLHVTDTFEICVESGTNWKHDCISSAHPYVFFPNNIEGLARLLPISPGICDIYLEGMRLFSSNIKVISPRVFKIKQPSDLEPDEPLMNARYDDDPMITPRISVFMNYNGRKLIEIFGEDFDFKEDTSRYLHCLDYNSDDPIEKENLFIRDIYPDSKEEWVKTAKFPCDKIIDESKFKNKESYIKYLDESIKANIDENAHNIIPLMAQYSAVDDDILEPIDWDYIEANTKEDTTDETGSITYDRGNKFTTFNGRIFNEPMVSLPYRHQYDTDEVIIIEIDDVKVPQSSVYLHDNKHLYIKKSEFNGDGPFNLTLKHLPIYNESKATIIINNEKGGSFKSEINLEELGDVQTLDDILVFLKVDDGYSILRNSIMCEGDKVFLNLNESEPNSQYLVLNSSFYEYRSLVIESEEQRELITLDDSSGFPNCSSYGLVIYSNGELLAENIDYFLTSQFTHRKLTSGKIIFKNKPEIGTVLEMYFFEQPRITCSNCKILDSEYDVVYIRNLKAGFSTKYMDLYINNVRIPDDRIIEIALNMVMIKDLPEGMIERPYTSAFVRSKLKRHLHSVQEYIDYYLDNQSKWKLYLDRLIDLGAKDRLDTIIKSFATDETTPHDTSLNVEIPESFSPILNEVGTHLLTGQLPRRIDANRVTDFLYDKHYIQLMSEDDWLNPAIELNANRKNLEFVKDDGLEEYRINAQDKDTGFKEKDDIIRIFSENLINRSHYNYDPSIWDANARMKEEVNWFGDKLREIENFENGDDFYNYDLNPISRELYLEELEQISYANPLPNEELDNLYIIDADYIDEDIEEEWEEETTLIIPFSKLRKSLNMDKGTYPDLTFFYLYNMDLFSASDIIKVNFIENIPGGKTVVRNNIDFDYIDGRLYLKVKPLFDTVQIVYKRKLFK